MKSVPSKSSTSHTFKKNCRLEMDKERNIESDSSKK